MAVYAVGDLQGCYDEFRTLLDTLNFDPGRDRLWLTGDLVNRGPGSLAALRYVKSLGPAALVVLGNHDLHLLAAARNPAHGLKRGDTLDEVLAAPDRDELLAWLAARPLAHCDPALGWSMVHAGLPPQWDIPTALACAREVETALETGAGEFFTAMYGDQPDLWSPALAGHDRLRFTVNCLTRLRVCRADGRLLLSYKGPAAGVPPGALPWFKVPGRRSAGARVLFGHWSALGYYDADGVVSLDTGCVWGGTLTALRLDAAAGPVQVACRGALKVGAPEDYRGDY
ncbi:MAG TPA: symmetrical bis(5'-nucleosyl)-tetraphosphatase [Steroidobacteraceae bacterium]|nr:symmetrical bis(5'-nucleosyl)-tetraphosphatase [Steroidobacteraceae bacterium]